VLPSHRSTPPASAALSARRPSSAARRGQAPVASASRAPPQASRAACRLRRSTSQPAQEGWRDQPDRLPVPPSNKLSATSTPFSLGHILLWRRVSSAHATASRSFTEADQAQSDHEIASIKLPYLAACMLSLRLPFLIVMRRSAAPCIARQLSTHVFKLCTRTRSHERPLITHKGNWSVLIDRNSSQCLPGFLQSCGLRPGTMLPCAAGCCWAPRLPRSAAQTRPVLARGTRPGGPPGTCPSWPRPPWGWHPRRLARALAGGLHARA